MSSQTAAFLEQLFCCLQRPIPEDRIGPLTCLVNECNKQVNQFVESSNVSRYFSIAFVLCVFFFCLLVLYIFLLYLALVIIAMAGYVVLWRCMVDCVTVHHI